MNWQLHSVLELKMVTIKTTTYLTSIIPQVLCIHTFWGSAGNQALVFRYCCGGWEFFGGCCYYCFLQNIVFFFNATFYILWVRKPKPWEVTYVSNIWVDLGFESVFLCHHAAYDSAASTPVAWSVSWNPSVFLRHLGEKYDDTVVDQQLSSCPTLASIPTGFRKYWEPLLCTFGSDPGYPRTPDLA
jgi:hypothetical protein